MLSNITASLLLRVLHIFEVVKNLPGTLHILLVEVEERKLNCYHRWSFSIIGFLSNVQRDPIFTARRASFDRISVDREHVSILEMKRRILLRGCLWKLSSIFREVGELYQKWDIWTHTGNAVGRGVSTSLL